MSTAVVTRKTNRRVEDRRYKTGKARKPVAFRKEKRQVVVALLVAFAIVLVFVSMFGYKSYSLYQQQKELGRELTVLQEQLEAEKMRKGELKEFEVYTKTKKYAAEVAQKNMNYVYDGETIYRRD